MKRMKKVLSLVLALALVFGLSATAFAADPQPYSSSTDTSFSITVTGAADGETYTAYKIFDVTYDGDSENDVKATNYSYTIDSNSAWYATVAAATDVFTLTQVNSTSTYLVTVNEGVENDAIIAVFTSAGVPAGAVAAATTIANKGTAVLDVTSSGPGYYYVTTTLGSLVIIDTTNPTQEIEEKNGIPTVSKSVYDASKDAWGAEDEADNNDHIRFELKIDNIIGSTNLVLHDSMDDELVIDTDEWDDNNFHMDGVYLYTSDDEDPTKLDEATVTYDNDGNITNVGEGDYYITVGGCTVEGCTLTGCAFEVHFLRDFSDVSGDAYVMVFYNLLLNTGGDGYVGDYEEIDNYATVTFATSSQSPIVEAETYSFGFEVYKYSGVFVEGSSETNTYYVLTDTLEHDGPAEIDNDFFLVATDYENNYYGVFNEIAMEGEGNFYLLTGWVDNEDEATSISEPDDGVELPVTIYVSPENMEALAKLFSETDVDSLLGNVRFHMLEEGGNADEQQDDDDTVAVVTETVEIPGTNGTPLANAKFQITNASGQTAYFFYEENVVVVNEETGEDEIRNIYLLEGWLSENETLPAGCTDTVVSGSDGMIYIEGLDLGTYTLTETKAPDGYNLLDTSITVTIWADFDTNSLMTDHGVTWTLGNENGTGVVNVENNSGTELPGTGGMGTAWFYIIGAILVCGAVVVLVTRRRVNLAA